jgi:hypothetical protein
MQKDIIELLENGLKDNNTAKTLWENLCENGWNFTSLPFVQNI